ncbi:MAG: BMC domain-containing protein [Deltaproteobacteria bacterium]|nr:BMC domain-containing protein [Deltaproteobacteria bacterium]
MSWQRVDAPPPPSLGLIELSSICRGIETTDRMLKAALVSLVLARTICSGKYIVMVAGEVHDVQASVEAGLALAAECTVDSFVIPDVHPDVFPALTSTSTLSRREAIGVLESFSVSALVEAVDRVAKAAPVEMVECRLAMALGGKAYLVFTGNVDAVKSSVAAGVEVIEQRGLLVNSVVIPNPRPELFATLI